MPVQRARSTSPMEPAASQAPRRVGRLGATVLLTAASLGLSLLPGTASATPGNAVTQAATAAEATRLVADAQHRLEAVTEQVNGAQVTLEQQQAAAAAAAAAVATAVAPTTVLTTLPAVVAASGVAALVAATTGGAAAPVAAAVVTATGVAVMAAAAAAMTAAVTAGGLSA